MEGSQPPPSPPADGPLEERVTDKNWKVRKEAYEELGLKFESQMEPSAEIFSTFGITTQYHAFDNFSAAFSGVREQPLNHARVSLTLNSQPRSTTHEEDDRGFQRCGTGFCHRMHAQIC